MAIQVLAPTSRKMGEQLALMQMMGQAGQQGVQNYLGYQERTKEAATQAKLAEIIGGKKGVFSAAQLDPTQIDVGSGAGTLGTAPTRGRVPGVSNEEALAMVMGGHAGPMLEQAFPAPAKPGAGFSLGPGEVRYGPDGKPIASVPAAPDPSSYDERLAAAGIQPGTPEAREFLLGRPPVGTTVNVEAAKPITGPAGAVMAMAPGAIAELPTIEETLFPGGEFDRLAAGKMSIPSTAEHGLSDSFMSGILTILRAESGGVINEGEIGQKQSIYMPSPLDNPDVARAKLERYRSDLNNTLAMQSRGRGEPAPAPSAPAPAPAPGPVDTLLQQGAGVVQQGLGAVSGMLGGEQPAAAAAPTAGIPPLGQREVGKVYKNPQGFSARWTGNGWEGVQ